MASIVLASCGGGGDDSLEVSKLEIEGAVEKSLTDHSAAFESAFEDISTKGDTGKVIGTVFGSCDGDTSGQMVDTQEIASGFAEMRDQLVALVKENRGVLASDRRSSRYSINAVDVCRGDDRCADLLSKIKFFLRVEKPSDGVYQVHLGFMEDDVEIEVGSVTVSVTEYGAEENSVVADWNIENWIALAKRIAAEIFGEEPGDINEILPTVIKGIISFGITLPEDGGVQFSTFSPAENPIEISGFPGEAAGSELKLGAFRNDTTLNGSAVTESFTSDGLSLSFPAAMICETGSVDDSEEEFFGEELLCSEAEAAGLFSVSNDAWGMEGRFTTEADKIDVDFTRPEGDSVVKLNLAEKTLLAVDAVSVDGLKISMTPAGENMKITFSQPVGLKYAIALSELERFTEMEYPTWLSDTILDIMLSGEPISEIIVPVVDHCDEVIGAPGQDPQDPAAAVDPLKIQTGILTVKSITELGDGETEATEVNFESGDCLAIGEIGDEDILDITTLFQSIECEATP